MPDDDVLKEATESLGVLPETGMERAKGIVLVEGKSDVTFLRHAASSFKQSGVLPASLEDVKIVPVLIGGSSEQMSPTEYENSIINGSEVSRLSVAIQYVMSPEMRQVNPL